MKRHVFLVGVLTSLLVTMASISYASINLNSSRSNVYRLFSPPNVVSPAQAASILKALDKIGPGVSEAQLRRVLTQQGVNLTLIKQIEIIPAADSNEKIPAVLLLDDPETSAAALSAACPGCVLVRHPLSKPNLKTSGPTFPAPGGPTFPAPPPAAK